MLSTYPFLSFLQSHGPHSGGVPVLSQTKRIRTLDTVHHVILSLHNSERGSTYKGVIRFVVADI